MPKESENGKGKSRHSERCPKCGRLVRDPENITNAEKFKSTFSPRIHAHGASNHGNEPEMREIAIRPKEAVGVEHEID